MRQNRHDDIHPIIVSTGPPRVAAKNFGSPYILLGGFILLITLGTMLLSFPFTNNNNEITPITVSLFTATSAATVTGLIVVDTASYWTVWGQLIIMTLISLAIDINIFIKFSACSCFLLLNLIPDNFVTPSTKLAISLLNF